MDATDGTFFLSLATMSFAFLGLGIRYCFQSKCRNCNICYGLIQIERDISGEIEEDKVMGRKDSNDKV